MTTTELIYEIIELGSLVKISRVTLLRFCAWLIQRSLWKEWIEYRENKEYDWDDIDCNPLLVLPNKYKNLLRNS